MKKNTKSQTALLKLSDYPAGSTVGLDIGDRWTHAAVLGSDGELLLEDRIESQEPAVRRWLTKLSGGVVAMEVGTHSRWMAKVGVECGHEVLVANPRRLRLIYGDDNKHDRLDAQKRARLDAGDVCLPLVGGEADATLRGFLGARLDRGRPSHGRHRETNSKSTLCVSVSLW